MIHIIHRQPSGNQRASMILSIIVLLGGVFLAIRQPTPLAINASRGITPAFSDGRRAPNSGMACLGDLVARPKGPFKELRNAQDED